MACPYSQASSSTPDCVLDENQVSYGDYLQLDKLLDCQKLKSSGSVHDEHLFIVIHQVYELWFKQILHELDSVLKIFQVPLIDERHMLRAVSRLQRMHKILLLLVDQVDVLETMTPFDFYEFRSFLVPASGFQSTQFRLLENRLGLKQKTRVRYNETQYWSHFTKEDGNLVKDSESQGSLLEFVEQWLERTPGLENSGFDFWTKYKDAVDSYLDDLKAEMNDLTHPQLIENAKGDFEKTSETFRRLFDEDLYNEARNKGDISLSYKAMQGAMMICLYRDEPRFHTAFMLLQLLVDVDEALARWRYRHVLMVQRMIGSKAGTGGSSGYYYLRATTSDKYRIFLDLANIATYCIPYSKLPTAPDQSLYNSSTQ